MSRVYPIYMEWISHSATGFFIGQIIVPEDERPRRAGWWWMLASISPDWLEFLTRWFGDIHRGVTHSLYFWPILALGWAAAARSWGRQSTGGIASWLQLWIAFFAIVGSHLLLDVMMPYRIYLAFPFSDTKWAWDIMPLYDVYIFAGWLLLWYAHRRWRLTSATTARIGLAVFVLVFAVRGSGKLRAKAILAGIPPPAMFSARTVPAYYQPWIWYFRADGDRDWKPLNIVTGQVLAGEIRAPFFPPIPGREHIKPPSD